MPKLLINKENCVFIEIESGKIDKDGVSRKRQKPQSGAGCFFATIDMFRNRYNTVQHQGTKERIIEKNVSTAKKLLISVTKKYLAIMGNLNVMAQNRMQITSKNIDGCIQLFTKSDKKDYTPEMIQEMMYFDAFLKEYKNNCNTHPLVTALEYGKNCEHQELAAAIEAIKTLLELDLEALYNQTYPLRAAEASWSELGMHTQNKIAFSLIQKKCYQMHCLNESNWHPNRNNFRDLLDQLRTNGPMLTAGRFGKVFYKNPNTPNTYAHKVDDKVITCLGYKADDYIENTHHKTSITMVHSVVLVGGNMINDKPFVYFLDPLDESLPDQNRKVYVMSYENFTKRMFTIHALPQDEDNGQAYAIYNSRLKLA